MILSLTKRMLREPDKRVLAKFTRAMAWHGPRAMASFRRRVNRGMRAPAFLFISLTDQCNLRCRGCWVTRTKAGREWPPDKLDAVIREYKQINRVRFFGLLGGEPLLYPHLADIIGRHPDCYFQVLTNGTLLDDARARQFRELGNVTPLISIEGNPEVSDQRRGGRGVHGRAMAALAACRRQRLIYGVAASICRNNIDDLANADFIRELIARGAHYLWYYIYRPVGPDPAPELCLTEDDILRLRRFMVEARRRYPIVLIDAYWDARGRAVCPAAEGISHHLGPGGDLEPCPPIQFSLENVDAGGGINDLFQHSVFLQKFRECAARQGRGCILLENPQALCDFMQQIKARDTTGRGSGPAELAAMRKQAGHDLPGREIPEQHWLYRFAKRRWFFGFGAYG